MNFQIDPAGAIVLQRRAIFWIDLNGDNSRDIIGWAGSTNELAEEWERIFEETVPW